MSNKSIDNLKEIFKPEIENLGYELVDIEFIQESGEFYLRFYIYHEDGINLDDCEIVSKHLDIRLDELDLINRQYYLEVSSPDLNRPLSTDDDLRRNLGIELDINLYKKINGKKTYSGVLVDYDESTISLEMEDGKTISLDREDISLIKVMLKF